MNGFVNHNSINVAMPMGKNINFIINYFKSYV